MMLKKQQVRRLRIRGKRIKYNSPLLGIKNFGSKSISRYRKDNSLY